MASKLVEAKSSDAIISMESADGWVFVLNPLQHLFGYVASQHRSRLVGLN